MMGDQYVSCVPNTIQVQQMQVIRNLIEVKIQDEHLQSADFEQGVRVQVRSEKPFTLNAYWIVKINDLHSGIDKDWQKLRDELWDNTFLDNGQCLYKNNPQIYQQSNEQVECVVKPPKPIDTTSLNVLPRDFYPLVVIVTCHEEEPNPQAKDAAANIHLIHIKDTVVPIKTHVIKQYIKQIDGRILDVSPLFVEETAACIICFEEASVEDNLQLFCLLPCRHSPICSNCIKRIRDCPKCRCPIASVFDVNSAQPDTSTPSANDAAIDPSVRHLYDDANEGAQRNRNRGGILNSFKSLFGL